MLRVGRILTVLSAGLVLTTAGCGVATPSAHPSASDSVNPGAAHTSPRPQPCGVAGVVDAKRLVDDGDSVALVEVTVSQPAQRTNTASSLVLVDSATLLAGTLPNGQVKSLDEDGDFLPPGTWVVLVGNEFDYPATYFVSDGLYGTFSFASSTSVMERCPTGVPGAGPSGEGPAEAISGMTAWFQTALGKKAKS